MYVVCIENKDWEKKLTIGKKYRVESITGEFYRVMCDEEYVGGWYKHWFKVLPNTIEDTFNSVMPSL